MPMFRAGPKLVYYAHVPKCAGSAVNWYLIERFGDLAFSDNSYTKQPQRLRWTRSSPQHIDQASLARLFPETFFDALFTIVRHPVERLVSAYHFQLEVEQTISSQVAFSDWLDDIQDRIEEDPFAFDNHIRPMTDIVPASATVFHIEHGLDHLVSWLDALTGQADGPRALPRVNAHGAHTGQREKKIVPTGKDLERIATLYAADFTRFGYEIGNPLPEAAAPELSPEQIAERDAFLKQFNSPLGRMRRKLGDRLGL